jgi:hypothetical protein
MEMFIVAHENYIYDELVDELEKICMLRNESENDLFRRVMQIYCRFPESDEPLGQEIFDWFSYLVSISEECDLNSQAISYSQNSDPTSNDIGDIISKQHPDTATTESLSVIMDPIDSECELFKYPPLNNH